MTAEQAVAWFLHAPCEVPAAGVRVNEEAEDREQINRSSRPEALADDEGASPEVSPHPPVALASYTDVGMVKPFARHLGVQFSWNANDSHEIRKRLATMVQRWNELGNFWFSAISKKLKKIIFVANVISAGLSGLTAIPASTRHFALLDSKVVGFLRAMMEGKAHTKKGNRHSKMTSAEVFSFWGILPLRFENLVRTFGWLKDIILKPGHHRQLIAAVWGDMSVDKSRLQGRRQDLRCEDILDPGQCGTHSLAGCWGSGHGQAL